MLRYVGGAEKRRVIFLDVHAVKCVKRGGGGLERSLTALGNKRLRQYTSLKRTLTRVLYVRSFFMHQVLKLQLMINSSLVCI